MPDDPEFKALLDKFIEQSEKDILDEWASPLSSNILAVVQDTNCTSYIMVMAVPPSALDDGMGPALFRTPDKNRFIGGINQDALFYKAEQIEIENPDSTLEERDHMMAEFISSFIPELMERAASMPELDI